MTKLPLLALALCIALRASDGTTDQPRILWTLPVAVSAGQSAGVQALAGELSNFLGQKGKVIAAETNACFCVEIKANVEGSKGYLLSVENAGARLTASDMGALKDGFEFLKSLAVRDNKGVKLATGKFTTMAAERIQKAAQAVPAVPLMPRNDVSALPNFAKVSEDLYRGGQPEVDGFRILKQMGVKTVVDLCALQSDRKKLAGLGLRYVHLSCDAADPEESKAVQFLKVLSNPANHPVFVHCHRGADRTGMMAATYRIVEQGWSAADAISELPNFKFGEGNKRVAKFLHFDLEALRKKVIEAKVPVVEVVP